MHVSNKALELVPVIYDIADELGFYACEKNNAGRIHPDANETVWMVLSRDWKKQEILTADLDWTSGQTKTGKKAWRDQYVNILEALK